METKILVRIERIMCTSCSRRDITNYQIVKRSSKMTKVIIKELEEGANEQCLCGKEATQVRILIESNNYSGEYLDDEQYFCDTCAKASDEMSPEDLI
jgi:hypothetical protein